MDQMLFGVLGSFLSSFGMGRAVEGKQRKPTHRKNLFTINVYT